MMTDARTYQFGQSRLTLRFGNIVEAQAHVIVSSDDSYITMGGGVSSAILRAGGEAIALDAAKKVPAALGDVVVTTAGKLKAQYVFHAITIGSNPEHLSHGAIVERTTRRCMRLLDGLRLSSIAFPAIGAGVARYSIEEVAAQMADVIADELTSRSDEVDATIYLLDRFARRREIDYVRFFEEFAARAPRLVQRSTTPPPAAATSKPSAADLAAETEDEYKRRRIHNLRSLLAALETQRGTLEAKLIDLLGSNEPSEGHATRKALADNQELRLQYLAELQAYIAKPADVLTAPRPAGALTVFVSSTSLDLAPHRAAVKDAIARCDFFFRGMENFGAEPNGKSPAKLIVEEVRKADVYVGVFGVRYGSIDPATGLSMTELEFREAETNKKPMLLYVMHADAVVPIAHIESDPEGQRKLAALKEHVLRQYVPYLFRSADDLGRQSQVDMAKLRIGT